MEHVVGEMRLIVSRLVAMGCGEDEALEAVAQLVTEGYDEILKLKLLDEQSMDEGLLIKDVRVKKALLRIAQQLQLPKRSHSIQIEPLAVFAYVWCNIVESEGRDAAQTVVDALRDANPGRFIFSDLDGKVDEEASVDVLASSFMFIVISSPHYTHHPCPTSHVLQVFYSRCKKMVISLINSAGHEHQEDPKVDLEAKSTEGDTEEYESARQWFQTLDSHLVVDPNSDGLNQTIREEFRDDPRVPESGDHLTSTRAPPPTRKKAFGDHHPAFSEGKQSSGPSELTKGSEVFLDYRDGAEFVRTVRRLFPEDEDWEAQFNTDVTNALNILKRIDLDFFDHAGNVLATLDVNLTDGIRVYHAVELGFADWGRLVMNVNLQRKLRNDALKQSKAARFEWTDDEAAEALAMLQQVITIRARLFHEQLVKLFISVAEPCAFVFGDIAATDGDQISHRYQEGYRAFHPDAVHPWGVSEELKPLLCQAGQLLESARDLAREKVNTQLNGEDAAGFHETQGEVAFIEAVTNNKSVLGNWEDALTWGKKLWDEDEVNVLRSVFRKAVKVVSENPVKTSVVVGATLASGAGPFLLGGELISWAVGGGVVGGAGGGLAGHFLPSHLKRKDPEDELSDLQSPGYQEFKRVRGIVQAILQTEGHTPRVILLIGKNGSGKSSFVNLLNSACKSLHYEHRTRPKDEAESLGGHSSTTTKCKAYKLQMLNKIVLTVVDTPGFDTDNNVDTSFFFERFWSFVAGWTQFGTDVKTKAKMTWRWKSFDPDAIVFVHDSRNAVNRDFENLVEFVGKAKGIPVLRCNTFCDPGRAAAHKLKGEAVDISNYTTKWDVDPNRDYEKELKAMQLIDKCLHYNIRKKADEITVEAVKAAWDGKPILIGTTCKWRVGAEMDYPVQERSNPVVLKLGEALFSNLAKPCAVWTRLAAEGGAEGEGFSQHLKRAAARKAGIIIHVHGYNNSVLDALGWAKYSADHRANFASVAFIWPSFNEAGKYREDEKIVQASLQAFQEFVAKCRDVHDNIVIFAHSMGSRFAAEILQTSDRTLRIIVAAADVGMATFKVSMDKAAKHDSRALVLCTDNDKALMCSDALNGETRVGLISQNEGIEMLFKNTWFVKYDNIPTTSFETGHNYYTKVEVADIIDKFLIGTSPANLESECDLVWPHKDFVNDFHVFLKTNSRNENPLHVLQRQVSRERNQLG